MNLFICKMVQASTGPFKNGTNIAGFQVVAHLVLTIQKLDRKSNSKTSQYCFKNK
jgi:hypothetical protein